MGYENIGTSWTDQPDPGAENARIHDILDTYPDKIKEFERASLMATLNRQRVEAVLYLEFKQSEGKKTTEDIKSMVRSDPRYYQASVDEITAKVEHGQVLNTLLNTKKIVEWIKGSR